MQRRPALISTKVILREEKSKEEKSMRFIPSKSFLMFGCLLLLFAASSAYGVTYTTVKNGLWTDPCTWNPGPMGGPCPGAVPPNNPIPAADTVNINHVVTFNTTPLVNFGTLRIAMVGGPAWLQIPSNVNVENRLGALMEVLTGRLLQCRFADCDDGQPYSAGNNPQPNQQSGVWVNRGGTVNIIGSIVEVAQRWTNEKDGTTPGTRNIIDSCVFTGQDFS